MISRVRIGGISSLELRTNPEIGGFSSLEIDGFSNLEVSSGLCPTGVGHSQLWWSWENRM